MHVLYLIFSEGYTSTAGPSLHRVELSNEAIRLTRILHASDTSPEVAGLLALMLLTDARRTARVGDGRRIDSAGRTGSQPLGSRARSRKGSRC